MTPEQKEVLERIKANDQHPERGEITLITEGSFRGCFVRETPDFFEWWHKNGQLGVRCNLKEGKLDGIYEGWHNNGQLSFRCNYENGKKDGLKECWYDNGQLEERCNFKEGDEEGLWECWHENGQLKFRCDCKDGRLNGLWEKWNANGQLVDLRWYKNNKLTRHLPFDDDTTRLTAKKKKGLKL